MTETQLHKVAVELKGHGSRVWLDGVEVKGVRDVRVHQPLEGPPIVELELIAEEVSGPAPEVVLMFDGREIVRSIAR